VRSAAPRPASRTSFRDFALERVESSTLGEAATLRIAEEIATPQIQVLAHSVNP